MSPRTRTPRTEITSAFGWPVWRDYEWRTEPVVGDDLRDQQIGPVLVPTFSAGLKDDWTHPLEEHPLLFRQLAALSPTPAAIRAFAREHGQLTVGRMLARSGPVAGGAESLSFWRGEITRMRRVVRDLEQRRRKTPPALEDVRDGINRQLRELTCAVLARAPYRTSPPRLVLHPKNLLGALWLQAAQALELERQYRRCRVCGDLFEVSKDTTGRRVDAIYCAKRACKQAAYRKRLEEKRRLKEEKPHRGQRRPQS